MVDIGPVIKFQSHNKPHQQIFSFDLKTSIFIEGMLYCDRQKIIDIPNDLYLWHPFYSYFPPVVLQETAFLSSQQRKRKKLDPSSSLCVVKIPLRLSSLIKKGRIFSFSYKRCYFTKCFPTISKRCTHGFAELFIYIHSTQDKLLCWT